MKYSLIDNKDVIVSIDENIEKLKKLKIYNDSMSIIPSEPHHKKGLNLNTYTVMTNKEKIEKGIIKLEDNQVFFENEDYIATLLPSQKYENGKILEKTMQEKLQEGLIEQEEYDNYIIENREREYSQNLDGKRAELLESVLNNLNEKGLLTEEERIELENLNLKRKEIKEAHPKAMSVLSA